jgi:hypothetical protein
MSIDDRRCLCVNEAGQQRRPLHAHLLPIPVYPFGNSASPQERTWPGVEGQTDGPQRPLGKYESLGLAIGGVVDKKNAAYGDAFGKTEVFLKTMFPDGITPDRYGDVGLMIRMFDKLSRIATNNDPYGENPWEDCCGYAILGAGRVKP